MKSLILVLSMISYTFLDAKDISAESLTKQICTKCHAFCIVSVHKGDKHFWNDTVVSMYERGLVPLDKKTKNIVVKYLSNTMKVETKNVKCRRKPLIY